MIRTLIFSLFCVEILCLIGKNDSSRKDPLNKDTVWRWQGKKYLFWFVQLTEFLVHLYIVVIVPTRIDNAAKKFESQISKL